MKLSSVSSGADRSTVVVILLLTLFSAPIKAEDWAEEFAEAMGSGDIELSFRYRYEFVDQDSAGPTDLVTENANASTLLSRLVYTTGDFRGFNFTVNVDDIRPVVSSDFDDTRNGKTEYPIVADPKGTDVNIAAVTYTGIEDAEFVLGRQRILRSNQRFVGNVGWRQNEQTFDSATASYAVNEDWKLFYGYIDSVERLYGPDDGSPTDTFSGSTHLFDSGYNIAEWLNLFGYVYLMDLEGNGNAADSNKTAGLRVNGDFEITDDFELNYVAEYAYQEDYADSPFDYEENYYRLDGGVAGLKWNVIASLEVLSGSGNEAEKFQTPLATLHGFQGWADKFLITPPNGIEDRFVTGTAKLANVSMSLAYHDFKAENSSQSYGTEIDLYASVPFAEYYSVWVGAAFYDADEFATDTTKVWAMLNASF